MEFAEIPKDVLPGLSVLTVTGNVELTLENYRGILEYTGELVRVQVKGGQLKVTGEHLMISYYTNDEMKMTGNFTIETLTTLIAKFSNYFNNAEKKIDRVIQLLSNTLEKL